MMEEAGILTRKNVFITALVVACFGVFFCQWKGYGFFSTSNREHGGGHHPHTAGEAASATRSSEQLPEATLHAHQQTQQARAAPRTLDRLARPGPMPGPRPSPGGPGSMVQPQPKGSGPLSIIMPIYSVGIVIFFVYTVIKVVTSRNSSSAERRVAGSYMTDGARFRQAPTSSRPLVPPAVQPLQQQQNRVHQTDCCKPVTSGPAQEVPAELSRPRPASSDDNDDVEIEELRRRLEETEKAMEVIMSQLGNVSAKLTTAKQQQQSPREKQSQEQQQQQSPREKQSQEQQQQQQQRPREKQSQEQQQQQRPREKQNHEQKHQKKESKDEHNQFENHHEQKQESEQSEGVGRERSDEGSDRNDGRDGGQQGDDCDIRVDEKQHSNDDKQEAGVATGRESRQEETGVSVRQEQPEEHAEVQSGRPIDSTENQSTGKASGCVVSDEAPPVTVSDSAGNFTSEERTAGDVVEPTI